jgi:hypothetical protein
VKLAVGDDLWRIRLVQIALGSLACSVLFLAGRSFFSRSAGIAAGLLLAIYPPAIFFDGLIQKANLGLVGMVLLLWLAARARSGLSPLRFVLVGAALALLMLTREETILLVRSSRRGSGSRRASAPARDGSGPSAGSPRASRSCWCPSASATSGSAASSS